jgi:hypothetical protein
MTVSEQMNAANQYASLWKSLMPDFGLPGIDQFTFWAGRYSDDLVSRGINRAAGKFRKLRNTPEYMSLEDAVKYASSVMKNEALGIRRHDQRGRQIHGS